jgi:prolyl-tRNA synthetase
MNCSVINQAGQTVYPVMGCYGIGISRTLMASVEQHATEGGIIWPEEIAPFKVHLIPIKYTDDTQKEVTDQLYKTLKDAGVEVLLDDRTERAGSKFKDADLIGIPHRIIIGKHATDLKVEYVDRIDGEKELLTIEDALSRVLD